jgi:DNA repair exonuclease SbcCD ATPase subunit
MKLDKLVLVNWGALRSGEYAMGNMTLLTGPTGSGKSTLLDALQTVMTATRQNIFSYNPGQDETTQTSRGTKSKRTLWSYIVGAEDNLFARPEGAHGYVAAVFRPSEGEDGRPFTALMAVAARVDGSGERRQAVMERMALLIADDAALTLDDFVSADLEGNLQIVPVEKIESRLREKFPRVTNYRDGKREYLCQLYGRFRGQKSVSPPEAEAAAKAWSQSIAHKPIGSVDELVREQILEHDPVQLGSRISQIGDLMRQVHNLRVEGERLKASVGRLETIGQLASGATQAHEQAVQFQLVASKRALQEDNRQIKVATQAIEKLNADIATEDDSSKQLAEERKGFDNSLIRLNAQLAGIPEAEQKRRLQEDIKASLASAQEAVGTLSASIDAAEALLTQAKNIAGMAIPPRLRLVSDAVTKVVRAVPSASTDRASRNRPALTKLAQSLAKDECDTREALTVAAGFGGAEGKLNELFDVLAAPEDSLMAALQMQRGQITVEEEAARLKELELAERKRNLAAGGADYPSHIRHALREFQSDLPSARVQVLCDLIEPASDTWQAAIEGYMAGARFNFVVESDWEARAIEFVKARHLRASIIQGTLCLRNARPDQVRTDSIIHELLTDHPIAKAYLVEQYGGVVKVKDAEELRHTKRGLTVDGKGSGSRTMFKVEEFDSLVFGKAAKQLAFERAVKQHEVAEQELAQIREQRKTLQGLVAVTGVLARPDFGAATELESAAKKLDACRQDMERLNLSEVASIEDEIASLITQRNVVDTAIRESDARVGGHRKDIEGHNATLTRLQAQQDERRARVDADTARLKDLVVVNATLSFSELETQVDDLLATHDYSQQEVQGRLSTFQRDAERHYGDVREAIADYNQYARSDERFEDLHGVEARGSDFGPVYGRLVKLLGHVREQLAIQREVGLYKNIEELRRAEGSFKDVFTKQFCYEIRNAVDTGVKTLRALNGELEKLKFGTDKFRIDWSTWIPEFKEYYDFFTAAYDLSESQESSDLFGTVSLSAENCRIRDRLVGLLLSNDQERALKELQRVADFRNYRRYEIWKESDGGSRVALSEWGTGSGGQLETPAYIVRAAVVTNRLKHFEKGMNLKMLVNDESFAKMDERRAHDVIRFIRDSLGIQLICAMPTKHAGAIKSEFTKEWCFTRTSAEGNGEVDFVSEADERDLNPDALRDLWERRREEVRLQATLAFEAEEQAVA